METLPTHGPILSASHPEGARIADISSAWFARSATLPTGRRESSGHQRRLREGSSPRRRASVRAEAGPLGSQIVREPFEKQPLPHHRASPRADAGSSHGQGPVTAVAALTQSAHLTQLTSAKEESAVLKGSLGQLREDSKVKVPSSFEYNQVMKQRMANPYEYHHDLGMYYTRITPRIIVGSQPQTPEDVDTLARAEGVGVILNVQEDKDVEYWGVDLPAVQRRSQELGVEYVRRPAVDFDPQSLRRSLPGMVGVVAHAVAAGKTVYVHCTAGLGRSPAAVIAYLFWFSEPRLDLRKAYDLLTALRPCGPKWEAIRGATYDLAKNSPYQPPFEHLPSFAFIDVANWERDLIRDRVWKTC